MRPHHLLQALISVLIASCANISLNASIIPQEDAPYEDPAVRAAAVEYFSNQWAINKADAVAWADAHGMQVSYDGSGITYELTAVVDDRPMYYATGNRNAGISIAADVVRDAPYNCRGEGVTAGIWDAGGVRPTHQELVGRVNVRDSAVTHWHSTMVGGTIGATGIDAAAQGMAPDVLIDSYDWGNDMAEMASRAASGPWEEPERIYMSNHSYGHLAGWGFDSGWWYWPLNITETVDPVFGQYNDLARNLDVISHGAPYYLIIWIAHNQRMDNPATGANVRYWTGAWAQTTYNPATQAGGDGVYENGYDSMSFEPLAKNCLTIGAVDDAVNCLGPLCWRWPQAGTMAGFSSWGPADDGRIKPDVVGNGVGVYTTAFDSDTSYGSASGTSLAAPSICGSAAQLLELFRGMNYNLEPRASTMKALIIHTADDLGTAGPDYAFGWGLMNTKFAADIIWADSPMAEFVHIYERRLTPADPVHDFSYTSLGSAPVRATLCWTDPPGTATAIHDDRTPVLVNDLDVRVIGPGGVVYWPFILDVNNPANAATTADNTVDNVEQVLVPNAPEGAYTIRVAYKGTLSGGSQYYSLVVTTEPYPAPAPTALTASDGEYFDTVHVVWDAVAGIAEYYVYRGETGDPTAASYIGSTTNTTYDDYTVGPGTNYYYWAKSHTVLGDSELSNSDDGYALLILSAGRWKEKCGKKKCTIIAKQVTPPADQYFSNSWFIGIAQYTGLVANCIGPYTMQLSKSGKVWKYKTKGDAVITYKPRKARLTFSVWTNLPPSWAVYLKQ